MGVKFINTFKCWKQNVQKWESTEIGTFDISFFGTFQFQTFGPYGTWQISPKTKHIRFGLLTPKCPKSKQLSLVFGRFSFGFRTVGPMSKNQMFCPIWPYRCSVFGQKFLTKMERFHLDFWHCPNTELYETGQKLNVREPNVYFSDVDCAFQILVISKSWKKSDYYSWKKVEHLR